MNEHELTQLLHAVKSGSTSVEAAASQLALPRYSDLGFARVDHERELRCGFPEVVFCERKEPEHAAQIAEKLFERADRVLMTRASRAIYEATKQRVALAEYHEVARAITIERTPRSNEDGPLVAILAAGTSDLPVVSEAAVTARMLGARVETRLDVGVAGLHRLLAEAELLRTARVFVVVAGMEGALASVVGGLVRRPVIAVPTSVGYGASFHGLSALLTMLNSCSPNVATVNIDNGFGAGYLAALITADETARHERGS